MYNKVELCGMNTAKLPVLTEAEKRELLARAHAGDAAAREQMVEGNLRLVLSVVQRFAQRGENLDDLFQVGCIGLMKAIDNFNPELDVRFSTYGVPMIVGEIRRFLRDNNAIRVSRSMRDTAYRAMQTKEQFIHEFGKEPTIEQIARLHDAGCEIIRLAVPDQAAADALPEIVHASPIPVVADIHFDYRLALAAAKAGVHKIRINPGNIGEPDNVRKVAEACRERGIPIRIGVNGGSLDKRLLEKYGHPTAEALVESAFEHLELLEKQGFYDICVSMKSSTVPTMVAAARLFRARCDYPLHIGVTETGPVRQGLIKSAMGIGALLLDGIGDTIRVSLTDDPVQEVYAARDILKAAGLRRDGVNIVSCPTCGRTRIDLIGLVNRVDEALKNCEKPITVAVMGCVVNGPGEAREADIGIAGGDGWGMIFEKGVQVEKLPYDELLPALLKRIEAL